ncbi:MAG TPA: STAS domain-containing protein [Casimicrobiaceae bacterium]|nr:STAS domain-containing protein [Casimicrobiaceae bacterium]
MNDADAASDAVPGRFVASPEGWRFEGPLTLFNAQTLYESILAAPLPESGRIDFSGVTHADSAALAILIELQRRATSEGQKLQFQHVSPALVTLAGVYGVSEVIGVTP